MTLPDDEVRDKLKSLQEVPFTDDLKQRILAAAEQTSPNSSRQETRRQVASRRWGSMLTIAAGLGAAAVVVGTVLTQNPTSAGKNTSVTNVTPTKSSKIGPSQTSPVVAYGLVRAPLDVTLKATTPGSIIHAVVKNVGMNVIRKRDVFGVLAFPSTTVQTMLTKSDSLIFVDGPDGDLKPGQSADWSFEPIGSMVTKNQAGNISATLAFFQTGMMNTNQADVKWALAPVNVSAIKVHPRTRYTDPITHSKNQSFEVDATMTNTSRHPVSLANLEGIIWFGPPWVTDWTDSSVIRFLDRIHEQPGAIHVLKPGESTSVYFREIGPAASNFLKEPVHISILQK